MEWYIPITILPGIGLLILSTSNFLIALNNEIKELNNDKEKYQSIVTEKKLRIVLNPVFSYTLLVYFSQ